MSPRRIFPRVRLIRRTIPHGEISVSWKEAEDADSCTLFYREYTMDTLAFTTRLGGSYGSYYWVQVRVENEAGEVTTYETPSDNVKVSNIAGAENSFLVEFPKSQVKKITVQFARYYRDPVTFSELAFYAYDSLWDDTMALWEDDMHAAPLRRRRVRHRGAARTCEHARCGKRGDEPQTRSGAGRA